MTANGRLDAGTQLVTVEGQLLSPATASAYEALRTAAHRAGHTLTIYTPAGGYRSLATQADMHRNPQDYNLNPNIPLAAVGSSRHGQGRAVDIRGKDAAARAWCQSNAAAYGFSRPLAKADPDHYEHGKAVTTVTDPTPAPPKPLERRKTMTTIYVKSTSPNGSSGGTGSLWALAGDAGTPCPGNWIEFTRTPADGSSSDRGARMVAAHGNGIFLNDTEWAAYKALYTTPAGAAVSGLTAAEHNQLFDIANKGELGQALTSTAVLINEHTDEAVNGITLTAAP